MKQLISFQIDTNSLLNYSRYLSIWKIALPTQQNILGWFKESNELIVYYATRGKKVYFESVKFDAREKQGQ